MNVKKLNQKPLSLKLPVRYTIPGASPQLASTASAITASATSEPSEESTVQDVYLPPDVIFPITRPLGTFCPDKTVTGKVRGLTAANGYLFASTDTGHIYAFGGVPGDFSGDGVVNLVDLCIFAGVYLNCTNPTDPGCEEPTP